MSKRNFILLIIILIIAVAGIFGFLYIRSGGSITGGNGDGEGTNFFSMFNPFGSNNSDIDITENPALDTDGDGVITDEEMAQVKLQKISSMPVAGFGIFSKERFKEVPIPTPVVPAEGEAPVKTTTTPSAPPTEFATALRYVDKATGNIYQTFADKIEERKFSETVIPKIYDAYFGNQAQSVVMRRLKSDNTTIETFQGNLPKEKLGEDLASNQITGNFLVEGIKDLGLSPDTSKIFYLSNFGESVLGTIQNLTDSKKTQLFDSAFTEWNSSWPSSKIITLTTKPSARVAGHMYTLNVDNKSFIRSLGDINGLTTLMSPDGKLVLVGNSALSLFIYHTDTKTYEGVSVKTLPEKCVWNKTSDAIYCAVPIFTESVSYPDDWYRGEVSFSDQLWKINLEYGNAFLLADPILIPRGEDVDGIKLALDTNEDYLFFVNKKDSFLWKLDLR